MGARPNDNPRAAAAARAWRRRIAGGAVAVVSLVFALVVLAMVLASGRPSWWPRADRADPAALAAGEALENQVAAEISRVRPGAPESGAAGSREWRSGEWVVEISDGEAGAWLNTRLRKWLANRGAELPEVVRQIGVSFGDGAVRLGASVGRSGEERIVSASATPEVAADGSLWLRRTRVYAGRLPLPASWLLSRTGAGWPGGEVGALAASGGVRGALLGEGPAVVSPALALGDGRLVRVVGVEVKPGRLIVTCRTEAAPK